MEVREDRDVDAESAKYRQPARLLVERAGICELLVEVEMEVAHQDFVAGHRLVDIIVRESHYRLLRGAAVERAQIEVDGHALHRSGRRVVKREIVEVSAGLADAPIPDRIGDPYGLAPTSRSGWRTPIEKLLSLSLR